MITVFRITDALRCALMDAPNGFNMAAPTESIVRCRPLRNLTLWAQTFSYRPDRVTVGDWDGIKLTSLASARTRAGIRSWEIDRLHIADSTQTMDLLEQAAYSVGCRGAERVFLRIPYNSKLITTAIEVGFFPSFDEVHLVGTVDPLDVEVDGFSIEQRTPADLQGLFQLYSIATPPEIRQRIGMTIDQWSDSQEPRQTKRNESVLKFDGRIIGWQMSDPFGPATAGQIMSHPEYPESTQYLIDISHQTQNWLVPNYQKTLVKLLKQQGLQEVSRYAMLIKTVSVPVRSPEFSCVEA